MGHMAGLVEEGVASRNGGPAASPGGAGPPPHVLLSKELTKYLSVPMSLRAFVLLGLPAALAASASPLSARDLVAKLPTSGASAVNLERILRHLANHGFLREHVAAADNGGATTRRYELDGMGKLFGPEAQGPFLSAMVLMGTEGCPTKAWCSLHECVLDPKVSAFEKANGMGMYEWMDRPDGKPYAKVFNGAQEMHSLATMDVLLRAYGGGFASVGSIVDVGGGVGVCMGMLVKEYPSLRAVNFDLPHVIASAPKIPGVEHVSGDMFATVPSGDAIFLKFILHNWDDEHCLKLLKNCHKATPDSGKLMIAELVMPLTSADDPMGFTRDALFLDLVMMANLQGGRERTEQEYRDLVLAAGFSKLDVVVDIKTGGFPTALMEVTK